MKKAQLKEKIDGKWVVISETNLDNSIPCSFSNIKDDLEMPVCEVCDKEASGLFPCERCDQLICDDCQAEYNQFTQIDYNFCKSCAEFNEY